MAGEFYMPLRPQHALRVIGDVAYKSREALWSVSARPPVSGRIMAPRNHRLLVIGNSIAAALMATYRVERACAMHPAFLQSSAAFSLLPDDIVRAAWFGRTRPQ